MDKKTRFNAAYDYLLSIGRVHKQKDIAAAMSSTEANISQALKGHPKVLTDNFLLRFHPSNWEIVDCDVKRDTYVAHAMYRLSKEYEEGTIKDYSVAMWY